MRLSRLRTPTLGLCAGLLATQMALAHTEFCGTDAIPDDQFPIRKSFKHSLKLKKLPLAIHIVRFMPEDEGDLPSFEGIGPISSQKLLIKDTDADQKQKFIQFGFNALEYVEFNEPDAINIYAVQNLYGLNRQEICGAAIYPEYGEQAIFVKLSSSCQVKETILHQLKHFEGIKEEPDVDQTANVILSTAPASSSSKN